MAPSGASEETLSDELLDEEEAVIVGSDKGKKARSTQLVYLLISDSTRLLTVVTEADTFAAALPQKFKGPTNRNGILACHASFEVTVDSTRALCSTTKTRYSRRSLTYRLSG